MKFIFKPIIQFCSTILILIFIRFGRLFEIGVHFRYIVLIHIFIDHVYNIRQDDITINSTNIQHEHYDNTISIVDFLINSIPILIIGLLISILTFLVELIYRFMTQRGVYILYNFLIKLSRFLAVHLENYMNNHNST